MINEDNVRKLIAGLRSGLFEQCHATLTRYSEDGEKKTHCCLGVATVIAMENGVELFETKVPSGTENTGYVNYAWGPQEKCTCSENCTYNKGSSSSGVLPDPVMEFYGFPETNPILDKGNGTLASAVTLNDTYRLDFGGIADAFERTFVPQDVKS